MCAWFTAYVLYMENVYYTQECVWLLLSMIVERTYNSHCTVVASSVVFTITL